MTRIVAEKAFNMNALNGATFGDPSPRGINALAFDYGPGLLRVWGSYDFNQNVGATSGNFTAFTYISGGSITARINSFSVDAVEYQELATANGWRASISTLMTGSDTLEGSNGRDVLYGFAGDDNIFGNGGNDRLYGGTGNDRVFGTRGSNYLEGNSGNDRLVGAEGADVLRGGRGSDSLVGGDGDDRLAGGAGRDYLHGGEGDDDFVFYANGARDIIYDLAEGDQVLIGQDLQGDYANAAEMIEDAAAVNTGAVVLDLGTTRIRFAGYDDVDDIAGYIVFL